MTRVGHHIRLWETQGLLTVRRGKQEVFWLNNRIFWQQQASATQQNANIHSTGVQIQGAHAYIATHSTKLHLCCSGRICPWTELGSHINSSFNTPISVAANDKMPHKRSKIATSHWSMLKEEPEFEQSTHVTLKLKSNDAPNVHPIFSSWSRSKNDQPPLTPMNGDWSMHHDPNTCLAFRQDTSSDQHCPKTAWTHLSRAVQRHQHLANKRNEMAK